MILVGQPSITVIIIFKCTNKGRTKGKLLRTTLMIFSSGKQERAMLMGTSFDT
jgi:hypothetical protein